MKTVNPFNQCSQCGSYMPPEWKRCGRCGHPIGKSRSFGKGIRLFFLMLVLVVVLIYKDSLLALLNGGNSFEDNWNDAGKSQISYKDFSEGEYKEKHTPSRYATTGIPADNSTEGSWEQPAPTAPESSIEEDIREALLSGKESVRLTPAPESQQVFQLIEEIVFSEPLILFYEGCSYRSDGMLTLNYSKSKDFILKAAQEVKSKADIIIKSIIEPGMTDFEKERAIHDYIIQTCRYNSESVDANVTDAESHSAYGVLIRGKAVCEGYAKAMKLLLDHVDIESQVVLGNSKNQPHAWNIVKINNAYYHVDATWNDPVMASGEQVLQYTYFNLTDDEISRDHQWEKKNYPQCNQTELNYFSYYKKEATTPGEFDSLVKKYLEKGENPIRIRINNYSSELYNMETLLKSLVTELEIDLSYSLNENYGVMEIWWGSRLQ